MCVDSSAGDCVSVCEYMWIKLQCDLLRARQRRDRPRWLWSTPGSIGGFIRLLICRDEQRLWWGKRLWVIRVLATQVRSTRFSLCLVLLLPLRVLLYLWLSFLALSLYVNDLKHEMCWNPRTPEYICLSCPLAYRLLTVMQMSLLHCLFDLHMLEFQIYLFSLQPVDGNIREFDSWYSHRVDLMKMGKKNVFL